jgi:tetratricopeptide (TPR) repeat protein
MIYQRLTVSLFIVLALPCSIFAQRSTPTPQNDNELWRVRAQTITEDVLKDASNLNSLRRALVWSKVAELWWLDDPRRARTWITNAVEVVEQVPNRESTPERRQRLATAKLLLGGVASRLDQKLNQRLIALVSDVDNSTSADDRNGSANTLIHAAIGMADPKRAAELGAQALRLGVPSDIADLLFALRGRDAKLADGLFEQALILARQNHDPSLLDALTYAAFPKQKGVSDVVLEPPDNLKAQLLSVQVAFLSEHVNELGNGTGPCWAVAAFIAPVLSQFDRLLPQQALLVRQTVPKCQSTIAAMRGELENSDGTQPLNTIDALLKAAENTDIITIRTQYQYRAARLARDRGDYEQAIKILDSMSDESRQLMQGSWDAYHWDWAASAALDHFQNGRLVEMNVVLNGVPSNLQPFAKMAFLDRLPLKKFPPGTPTIQFLNDAAAGLRKSNISELEKYVWYFGLLKLTLRYQRADAVPVFKEAIASLNRAITEDSKFLDTSDFANFLPATLLEIDEFAVKETLASVTNLEARTQLRLQLLKQIQTRAW